MKKHTTICFVIWTLVLFLALARMAATLFAQDKKSAAKASTKPCPCDTNFVRRVNYRIERQLEVNGTVWSAFHDQKEINAVLEARLDSLAAKVRRLDSQQEQRK
jgi:hypothetical protein